MKHFWLKRSLDRTLTILGLVLMALPIGLGALLVRWRMGQLKPSVERLSDLGRLMHKTSQTKAGCGPSRR